jgi:chromate transport protein ChrA
MLGGLLFVIFIIVALISIVIFSVRYPFLPLLAELLVGVFLVIVIAKTTVKLVKDAKRSPTRP